MISINPGANQIMNEDALKAYPDECCGFLFGNEDAAGNRLVTSVLEVNNSSTENRKRRFEIAPRDYLKAEQFALDNELQLLGVYHSHPNHPAVPSEQDRINAQPWFSYIIISVADDTIQATRSWVLNDQTRFEEETVSNQLSVNNI